MRRLLMSIRRRGSFVERLPELPSQVAYAEWARTYAAKPHNVLMRAEEQAMLHLIPDVKDRVVLDLACGTGRWGRWAQDNGARHVIGLDNSGAMLRVGAQAAVAQAHMNSLPLCAEAVDVIICGLATGHLNTTRLQQTLVEIERVLQVGGVACISDFHPFLAWQGAQRTFQASDGTIRAVEHYRHSYADYFRFATTAGLTVTGVEEAFSEDQSRPLVLALALTKLA